jgi:Protein of unknwon function (DUF3310)
MKNGMSIRKFLLKNPNATTKAVVSATGASAKSVGSVRWALRKEGIDCTPTKRGRKPTKVVDLTAAGSPIDVFKIAQGRAAGKAKIRMQGTQDFEFGNSNVDLVNNPPHYTTGGIETIDFIEAKKLNYNLGNAVKYISRADHKGNRIEDLKKAKWYIEREILAQHI